MRRAGVPVPRTYVTWSSTPRSWLPCPCGPFAPLVCCLAPPKCRRGVVLHRTAAKEALFRAICGHLWALCSVRAIRLRLGPSALLARECRLALNSGDRGAPRHRGCGASSGPFTSFICCSAQPDWRSCVVMENVATSGYASKPFFSVASAAEAEQARDFAPPPPPPPRSMFLVCLPVRLTNPSCQCGEGGGGDTATGHQEANEASLEPFSRGVAALFWGR